MAGAAAEALDPNAQGGVTETPAAKPVAAPEKKPEPKEPVVEVEAKPEVETDDETDLGVTEKNGKKFVKLPYDKFKERIAKSTKKELREIFGTSDKGALLSIKKKYDDFEKDAEERKRADMSERQKLEADVKTAKDRADAAERKADRARDHVTRQKTERKIVSVAKEFVKGDKVEIATALFRSHVLGLSRKKADKLLRHEGEWFKEFAEKNPDLAKGASAASETPAEEQRHEKKPAKNGIVPKDKPAAGANAGAKKPKDMTSSELREYAAKAGVKLPQDMRIL